jgi:hypothetical protein
MFSNNEFIVLAYYQFTHFLNKIILSLKSKLKKKNIKTHAHACTQTIEQLTYKRNSFVSRIFIHVCISFILQTFQEKVSKYKIVCFVLFFFTFHKLFLLFSVKFLSFIFNIRTPVWSFPVSLYKYTISSHTFWIKQFYH